MGDWVYDLIEVLISGVAIGSIYAVMSIGMALVYGISRVFNFAYGSFYTWGAYFAWVLSVISFQLGYPLIFPLVALVMFFLGMGVERGIICPLRWKPKWQDTTMMATLGLALFLDNLALVIFGPFIKSLPPLLGGYIDLLGFSLSMHEIGMLVVAIFLILGLGLFLKRTKQGMSMRAVAQDPTGAQIVGIPINRVFSYTFGISTALVGISGIFLAPKYYVNPLGGWEALVKAFVIVAFGGLGSIKGTLYGAFILGIMEALVAWQVGMMWTVIFWFSVLLGVLIIRPRGLFGTGE